MPDDNTVEVVIDDGQKPSDDTAQATATSTNGEAQRQRPQQDQRTRPQSQDNRQIPDDDENSYGRRVQKRIADYRRKLGAAEATGAQLQQRASQWEAEARRLNTLLGQQNAQAMGAYAEAAKAREMSAQKALKAAHDSGDGQAIVEATRELSAATSLSEQVIRQQEIAKQQAPAPQQQTQVQPAQQQQDQPQNRPRYSAETEAWIDQNPWFEDDDDGREMAMRIHNKLVDQGFTPDTKEYFKELTGRAKAAMPELFESGPDRRPKLTKAQDDEPLDDEGTQQEDTVVDPFNQPSTNPLSPREMRPVVTGRGRPEEPQGQVRPRYETTPVRRATPANQRQNGPVRLSPAQVEAARIAGVSLESYAKSLVHPSVATTSDGQRTSQRRT